MAFFGQRDHRKCDISRGLKNTCALRLHLLPPFETLRPCEEARASLLKGENITSADSEPTASHKNEAPLVCSFPSSQLNQNSCTVQPTHRIVGNDRRLKAIKFWGGLLHSQNRVANNNQPRYVSPLSFVIRDAFP